MVRFAVRRLLQAVITLTFLSVAIFLLLRALPLDPARIYAGPDASEATLRAVRAQWGLSQPIYVQYGKWLWGVVHANLGTSYESGLPATAMLGQAIPATLELTVGAITVSLLVGLPLGVLAAARRDGLIDWIARITVSLGLSVPAFLTGTLLIMIFGVWLRVLPTGGYVSIFRDPVQSVRHLVLPAASLCLWATAVLTRFTAGSVQEALRQDYVRTAVAKGIGRAAVVRRHALRNALLPISTIVGIELAVLLSGAVAVEVVFAYPGLGWLMIQSLDQRDFIVLQDVLLVIVAVFVCVGLLVDLLFPLLDPRTRSAFHTTRATP